MPNSNKTKQWLVIALLFIAFVVLVVTLQLVQTRQVVDQRATGRAEVDLLLSPNAQHYDKNQTFTIDLQLKNISARTTSREVGVSGAQAGLTVDGLLEVVSVDCVAPFNGLASYSWTVNPQSGQTEVAVICAVASSTAVPPILPPGGAAGLPFGRLTLKAVADGRAEIKFLSTGAVEVGAKGAVQMVDVSTAGVTGVYYLGSDTGPTVTSGPACRTYGAVCADNNDCCEQFDCVYSEAEQTKVCLPKPSPTQGFPRTWNINVKPVCADNPRPYGQMGVWLTSGVQDWVEHLVFAGSVRDTSVPVVSDRETGVVKIGVGEGENQLTTANDLEPVKVPAGMNKVCQDGKPCYVTWISKDLPPGIYDIEYRALGSMCVGPTSTPLPTVTTPPSQCPACPTSLSATLGRRADGTPRVALSWPNVANNRGYDVYRLCLTGEQSCTPGEYKWIAFNLTDDNDYLDDDAGRWPAVTDIALTYRVVPSRAGCQTPTACTTAAVQLPPAQSCPAGANGNLNCDAAGLIDELDLRVMLDRWSPAGPVPTPRPNQHTADIAPTPPDNRVDGFDVNRLLRHWRPR